MYCNNNFSGKYWAIFGPKFPDRRITGIRITEGPLYTFFFRKIWKEAGT
jgi:hypothetical protein